MSFFLCGILGIQKTNKKSITYKNSINQKEDFEDWGKQLKTENKMCVKDENEISTQKTTTTTTTTRKKEQDWSLNWKL